MEESRGQQMMAHRLIMTLGKLFYGLFIKNKSYIFKTILKPIIPTQIFLQIKEKRYKSDLEFFAYPLELPLFCLG